MGRDGRRVSALGHHSSKAGSCVGRGLPATGGVAYAFAPKVHRLAPRQHSQAAGGDEDVRSERTNHKSHTRRVRANAAEAAGLRLRARAAGGTRPPQQAGAELQNASSKLARLSPQGFRTRGFYLIVVTVSWGMRSLTLIFAAA